MTETIKQLEDRIAADLRALMKLTSTQSVTFEIETEDNEHVILCGLYPRDLVTMVFGALHAFGGKGGGRPN